MTRGQNKLIQKLNEKNASQGCFKEAQFLKRTIEYHYNIYFSLATKEGCNEAMAILETKNYMHGKLPLKYLVKTDLHQQKGVMFLEENVIKQIQKNYENGTKCGEIKGDWTF